MQIMQKKAPVSTVSRLKYGLKYPTIKALPHDEKCKMSLPKRAAVAKRHNSRLYLLMQG